jgi:hypothetical protein
MAATFSSVPCGSLSKSLPTDSKFRGSDADRARGLGAEFSHRVELGLDLVETWSNVMKQTFAGLAG